jgi:transcriptional regulator with AAA-type ATPase domain/tetratricopeptide (TPR) repeat protein
VTPRAGILGDSAGIRRLRDQLEHVLKRAATARRPPPVLLYGETGTGKGLVAGTIHRAGPRASGPFVDVNCAAIPETLLEAELFGYERGAFTDARQAKPGLFQLAHRGMLFLDEIGMLPPALQAKLLKVLEDGVVRRLGSTRTEAVDVWIVSATNEDLTEALRARRFREDLYHRLAVLSLELPPLRERGSDIVLLADRFLARACTDYGLAPKTFARDARAALAAHGWPGNVRELGNVVERVALLADESVITAALLALPVTTTVDDPSATESVPGQTSRDLLRAHLLEVLTETGWNISQTAVRLGVARNTVLSRMARFGLNRSAATQTTRPQPRGERAAETAAPTDVSVPFVATSRAAWEPRRVALLRVDLIDGSRLFDDIVGKVETFDGAIVELGPSAFVAAFGLAAIEDAAVRAALAAVAVSKAIERARGGGERPRVKIVMHVAQALVTQLQGVPTMDLEGKRAAWTTIEALAGLGEFDAVIVSEAAAPFLERRFELTPATASDPIPFHRLTRREPTGFGLGGRPLSRFVGRDGELRLVTDRVADAARGHGQVIGIVGEPGVGKSRFVYELTRLDAVHGWRVLGSRGVSHGSTTPLLPVSELLRRYFGIEDADEPELIREKVTKTIRSRHEGLTPFVPPLLSLLDLAVDDPSWRSLDPSQQHRKIQDAIKSLLLNESRIQPLVLIVEDLHWIDAQTQTVLDGLVESVPTARLVLLVTYRPEYQHGWGSKTYYSQLRLDALPPARAGDLLEALLGDDPALEPLKQLLVERGNPFVIEESLRALLETQALVGEPGAYRLTRPIQAIQVPATVQVILAARIDRLSGDHRPLLQTASVIGKDVPVVLLYAVTDTGEDEVQQVLAHLRAAEFLYETRFFPDAEYTFKHALTHEVTYGTVTQDRRKALHARIVGAIERAYRDRLTEHVERLADHAVRGELWEQAVRYHRQAGAKALARSAHGEAVHCFEQALTALGHRPESRETLEQAIDLRFDLRNGLLPLGEFERTVGCLREAEGLARRLGDQRRLGQVAVYLCQILFIMGHPTEALMVGQDARAIAESLGDLSLRVTGTLSLGATCLEIGDYRRAEDLFRAILPLLEGDQGRERFGGTGFPAVMVRAYLAWVLGDEGKFKEGTVHGQEAIRLAEAFDHPYSLAFGCWTFASLQIARGELSDADRLLERGLALTREWNMPYFSVIHSGNLGYVYALLGRTAEGIPLLQQALSVMETMRSRFALSLYLARLSEAYLLSDRLDRVEDALALARRALTLAREGGQRNAEARTLRLLGDVTARGNSPEEAESHYRDALALAEELGMRPLVAHCHAGLGRLLERTDQRGQSRQHLPTAMRMYREMEMTYWLEKVSKGRTPSPKKTAATKEE